MSQAKQAQRRRPLGRAVLARRALQPGVGRALNRWIEYATAQANVAHVPIIMAKVAKRWMAGLLGKAYRAWRTEAIASVRIASNRWRGRQLLLDLFVRQWITNAELLARLREEKAAAAAAANAAAYQQRGRQRSNARASVAFDMGAAHR